jgi:hypothetical protein
VTVGEAGDFITEQQVNQTKEDSFYFNRIEMPPSEYTATRHCSATINRNATV